MKRLYIAIACSLIVITVSCSPKERPERVTSPQEVIKPAFPTVTKARKDLLFRYRTKDGWAQAISMDEVPAGNRSLVQVIDLSLTPKERDSASFIHLVDLTAADGAGLYPGHTIARSELETALAQNAKPEPQTPIVMYSTSWCGVCKKAAKYMRKNDLVFVEKDIEKDRAAASELMAKKKAQGVPGNGVPVFDIGGKLIGGFDPGTIMKLARPKG
jgi:glutaredoxin